MARDVRQIRIESILGGHSPTTHFGRSDQFRGSLGIDPAQPFDDNDSAYSTVASGILRPSAGEKFSGTTITSAPLWISANPKNSLVYVLDANGSAYTIDATITTVSALSDAGELSNGTGNGMEYYDNYIYFSKNTTVARYGPLNGSPTMNGNYWAGTLAKTALVDTSYPTTYKNSIKLPNHILKRHSDGRLYIADVVGNRGTLHYIATTNTTVEGDTDNASTYNAVQVGYGLWPTAIESYGEDLAIAFYDGSGAGLRQARAKMAFWDTTSTNVNKLVWVEFPDSIITAMKNVNGVLYVVSGNVSSKGFRVTRFVGGYQYQEVYQSETGEPCLPGAVDAILNRFIFGTYTTVPETDGTVLSVGLQKEALGNGVFSIARCTGANSSTNVTAVSVADNMAMGFQVPIIGWTQAGNGSTGVSHGLDKQGSTYSNAPSVFWSSLYRIGESFKITRITIPLATSVQADMIVTPTLYFDNGQTIKTLTAINNTNYSGEKNIVYNIEGATGENNFWLQLKWTGAELLSVELPIVIEYEIIKS